MTYDLRRHASILRGAAAVIGAVVLLAIVAGLLVSSQLPRVFESRSTLYVGQSLNDPNLDYNGILASQIFAQTYARLATSRPVLETVIDDLAIDETPASLAGRVAIELPAGTTLLSIVVRHPDPARAAAIANAVARELQAFPAQTDTPEIEERLRRLAQLDAAIAATQGRILELLGTEPRSPDEQVELATAESRLTTLTASRNALADTIPGFSPSSLTLVEAATQAAAPVGGLRSLIPLAAALVGLALAIGFAYVRDAWRRPMEPGAVTDDVEAATSSARRGARVREAQRQVR